MCVCYLHTQTKLLVTAIYMWWCIHVHTVTSQGRNLERETIAVSSILRTAWEPTVAAAVFVKWNPGGISRIVEGKVLIEVAGMSGTLFFTQSNADVSLVWTHICWVLTMTTLPVKTSRYSDIMHQLQGVGLWGFFKDGTYFYFIKFIYHCA